MLFEEVQIDRHTVAVGSLGYGRNRSHSHSIPDKANSIMGSVAIRNEQALLAICGIPCPGIEVALQLLCRELVGGESFVTTVTTYMCATLQLGSQTPPPWGNRPPKEATETSPKVAGGSLLPAANRTRRHRILPARADDRGAENGDERVLAVQPGGSRTIACSLSAGPGPPRSGGCGG